MPKLSATVLKARIDQLQKQLAAAEANKGPAIKKVRALMKKLGVTISDLQADDFPARRQRAKKSSLTDVSADGDAVKRRKTRGKVAVKFRDDLGNTWTGRGKTPRWISEAEKAGKSRDSFKIG